VTRATLERPRVVVNPEGGIGVNMDSINRKKDALDHFKEHCSLGQLKALLLMEHWIFRENMRRAAEDWEAELAATKEEG
jgi:hypothetical protein